MTSARPFIFSYALPPTSGERENWSKLDRLVYDVPVYTHCKTDEILGVTAVEDIRSEEWQRNKNRKGLRMLTMWMMWLC